MNRGMVGKLPVKKMSHWRNIDTQYWTNNCDLELHHNWGYGWRRSGLEKCNIEVGMVRLQHALVAAGKCKDGNISLAGELHGWGFRRRDRSTLKQYYRTPYHDMRIYLRIGVSILLFYWYVYLLYYLLHI